MKKNTIIVSALLAISLMLNSCTAISGYLSKDEAYQTLDEIAMQYEKLDSRPEGIGEWTMEPMCERYYFNISSWFIGHWLKDRYPLVVDSLRDPSNPYEENRVVVNDRLSTRTYYIGSGVEFKVKWHHAFSKPCLGVSVTSHRKDALQSTIITAQVKDEIVQKVASLKMDKSDSDNKLELQRQKEKASSKRSWKAVLSGINAGLSTTASDMNRINNNINNATATRATPKRWQDMSESEKKVEAEKYKYLNGSEVKKNNNSINNGANTCYIVSRINDYFPNQDDKKTNTKATIKPIGSKATHGRGTIAGNIELKFQSQGSVTLQVSNFEVVKMKQNSPCQFNNIEEAFAKVNKNYKTWRGKHYYIKMFLE